LHDLLQLTLNVIVQTHLVAELLGIEDRFLPALLLLLLSHLFVCILVILPFAFVLFLVLLIMLSSLEFHVDIDDLISEDEVLVVPLDPRRFWSILHLTDFEAGEDEVGIDLGRVLLLDVASIGHEVAKFGPLSRVRVTRM
jgi:hypothetical protein